MSEFLYHYHPVEPATWFYFSSLLTIGLFFKFSRLWSVRNLDLLLLIMLAPGLLFVYYGRRLDTDQVRGISRDDNIYERFDEGLVAGVADPATEEASVPPQAPPPVDSSRAPTPTADRPRPAVDNGGDPRDAASKSDGAGDGGLERGAATQQTTVDPLADAESAGLDRADEVEPDPRTRGQRAQMYGYLWLYLMGALLLVRLMADPTMVRRPLLEPNLSAGGLTFMGCSLFVFLMANVISRPPDVVSVAVQPAQEVGMVVPDPSAQIAVDGPGYALLASMPSAVRKSLSVFGHLAIVVGMVLIGYWHFDNIGMGVGSAALYLMLPYTALMTNETKHVLPAASLVWAVLTYRRPLIAGMFLGLAAGMTYYPLFLLPLWMSFYWPRGLVRFLAGVILSLVILSFVLFSSDDVGYNIRMMFGLFPPALEGLRGIWDQSLGGWNPHYRFPVLAAFVALACSMALWPAQKNLGTLLSCSAAVMVGTQFWHGFGGGTYMAWYLPLLLLTIFRPNLEDRVAVMVLTEGWFAKRFTSLPAGRAA